MTFAATLVRRIRSQRLRSTLNSTKLYRRLADLVRAAAFFSVGISILHFPAEHSLRCAMLTILLIAQRYLNVAAAIDLLSASLLFTVTWAGPMRAFRMADWTNVASHFLTPFVITIVAVQLFSRLVDSVPHPANVGLPRRWFVAIASCAVGIASAAVWEIYEHLARGIFGSATARGNYSDTMADLIAGAVGALLGSTLLPMIQVVRRRDH